MIKDILDEADAKMDKSVEATREEFAAIRAGRANPAMFNKIMVDYYGVPTPVNQLASFHIADARMITVQPYDKSSLGAIERAIRDSDLGVNPTNDGTIIRVALPVLTEERRREYIKVAREKAEGSRVSIRSVRRHAKETLDRLARDGEVGEDDVARAEKQLETLTKNYIDQIDELLKRKEAELLEV